MSIKTRLAKLEGNAPRTPPASQHGTLQWLRSMRALSQALGFTGTLEELEEVIKCL